MLSYSTASPFPPSSSKPRQRAHTMLSPAPLDRSPSSTRSYTQPLGTASLRKSHRAGSHSRSRSHGDVLQGGTSAVASGKRRAVFCDIVLDELELDDDEQVVWPSGPIASFLNSLGTPVHLPVAESSAPQPVRPVTPGKTPKVDYDKVRQNLHELWITEESYLRKMTSLLRDYAVPLRSFSKKRETAIIPSFEATHLFINIEQLVPVAEAFEKDLQDIVRELQRDRTRLPPGFGEVILRHVERMQPYKKWLANVAASEAIRQGLEKSNSSFREFIERTQVYSRESAQTTGGFKEFLAEPFQRISRYRLMIDPMSFYLPPDDPSVEPLQIAAGILSDICSMKVDDATKRAAVFWSLTETIDGFPDALVASDRRFITCIDADEIIEVVDSRPTTLRCTLFLFNDTLLIAKRPSTDRPGKALAGLDDLDRLVGLYQTSHLSSTQAHLLGSPKKLRRSVFGFRGLVPLSELAAVDLGSPSPSSSPSASPAHEFGLLFDSPPTAQSERWNGRPARRFVVAGTYPSDVQRPEKEVWLKAVGEAVLRESLARGARKAIQGGRRWSAAEGEEATEVGWAVWDRRTWEGLDGKARGKLALHLVDEDAPSSWISPKEGRPAVSARATFVKDRCLFEVKSVYSASESAEPISVDRIVGAVADVAFGHGLFSFPNLRPLSLAERPSRPRSNLLAVFDVFASGSSSLKRGHSMTSKTSSVATTTVAQSPALGGVFASLSPRQQGREVWSQSVRVPLTKKSAPDLYSSVSRREDSNEGGYGGMAVDEREAAEDVMGSLGVAPGRNRRAAGRRSLSLPPPAPQAQLNSSSASPDNSRETFFPFEDAEVEAAEPSPVMDALVEPTWPLPQELEAPTTSPMAYRPQVTSTRRRMMGPRDMRSPSSAASAVGYSSPAPLPFAREQSPTPQRRPHTSNTSTITDLSPAETYQSSPIHHDPTATLDVDSQPGSSSKRTRPPIEMSPRAAPAKKVASLVSQIAPPRQPSSLAQPPMLPGGRRTSCSAASGIGGERRIPSSSSTGRIHVIRARRVTSGATIRGPPVSSPPQQAVEGDVFSSEGPATPVIVERKAVPVSASELEDVEMDDLTLPPIERLRKHVDHLRLKLSREVANKENGSIASPTALSRSPHTRNVYAKTLGRDLSFSSPGGAFTSATNSFASFGSEPRAHAPPPPPSHSHTLDLSVLSRWTRKLGELVEACQTVMDEAEEEKRRKPSTPEPVEDAGAALEVAMLEQERDLLAADLEALKEEAAALVDQELQAKKALAACMDENVAYRQAYVDICNEADILLAEFNIALEGVTLSAQADPSATGEYVELVSQLEAAVVGRFQAEHDLKKFKREVKAELDEKARWGELLRAHGLLPPV